MSALAADAPADRRCPNCGSDVVPEQDWCLECGRSLRRHVGVASSPSRGRPALLPLLAAAVVGALVGLGLSSLLGGSGDPADRAAQPPRTVTVPTPSAPPATDTTAPASPTTSAPASTQDVGAPLWPRDAEAYTVVLMSSPNPADAARRARALARNGADAGVLLSDEYADFPPGRWVVWRGRYEQRDKAEEALRLIERAGREGYITFVRRRA